MLALLTKAGFQQSVQAAGEPTSVGVILDRTNFYAEQGGQIYDTGRGHVGKTGGVDSPFFCSPRRQLRRR